MIDYKRSWERLSKCIESMGEVFEKEKKYDMWAVCRAIYAIMPGLLWEAGDETER